MSFTITTKTEITTDHLVSLFISVIESNASTYWASGGVNVSDAVAKQFSDDNTSWWFNPNFYEEGYPTLSVTYSEDESEDTEETTVELTPQVVENGLNLAAKHFPDRFNEFAKNEGFDIEVADVIFQCIVLQKDIIKSNTTGWNAPDKRRHVDDGWQVVFG